jgi:hypothetical protein
MKATILAFLASFLHGVSAAGPAPPVRADWTEIPQGRRILPRINDTLSVNSINPG